MDQRTERLMEAQELIAPALALTQQIQVSTNLRPTALMLPVSLADNGSTAFGYPMMAGNRVALVYEAGRI